MLPTFTPNIFNIDYTRPQSLIHRREVEIQALTSITIAPACTIIPNQMSKSLKFGPVYLKLNASGYT